MQRRKFLSGALTLGAMGAASSSARAYTRCMPHMQFGQVCESGLSSPPMIFGQRMSQWCWAASVQMAFAHYGHAVSQQRIVAETYGIVENIPAITGYAISKNLQRQWVDDDGDDFSVEIEGLYDFDAGIIGITDASIVNALDGERPIIMGTRYHAVLLLAVGYVSTNMGPQIVDARVADPFPGIGIRGPQTPADLVPMHRGGNLRYLCLSNIH